MATEPERLYQLSDLAKLFGVGPSAVTNWRKRGTGPALPEPKYVTTGGKPLFTRDQLDEIRAWRDAEIDELLDGT